MTQIRRPEHLGDAGYVKLLSRIGEGLLAFTFLGHVMYGGSLRRAYLKFYDTRTQPMAPMNELLGFMFSQAMGMPSPDAFIVDVPARDLEPYGLKATSQFVRATGTLEAHQPGVAGEGTAKSLLNNGLMQAPEIRARLLKSPAGRTLIAFDEALGNSDRNMGNVVFPARHGVVAIDHGCILSGPAWTPLTLNSTVACENLVWKIVNMEQLTAGQADSIQAAADVLVETYYEALPHLATALSYRDDLLSSAAFDYVWWRALHLQRRMTDMLTMVV